MPLKEREGFHFFLRDGNRFRGPSVSSCFSFASAQRNQIPSSNVTSSSKPLNSVCQENKNTHSLQSSQEIVLPSTRASNFLYIYTYLSKSQHHFLQSKQSVIHTGKKP